MPIVLSKSLQMNATYRPGWYRLRPFLPILMIRIQDLGLFWVPGRLPKQIASIFALPDEHSHLPRTPSRISADRSTWQSGESGVAQVALVGPPGDPLVMASTAEFPIVDV